MSTSEVTLEDTSKNKSDVVKKWKSVIEEMSFDEISLLEYNTEDNPVFRKMFPSGQNSLTKSIRCSLCETATMTNFKSLNQHIHGKKHMFKVESTVMEYLHPTIDPLKNAAGVIKIEEEKRSETRKVKDSKVFLNPLSISADMKKHGTEAVTDVTLTKENLRENMNKFLLNDLLLVEYRFINTKWEKLFKQISGIFVCTMCKSSPLPHLSAIKQHMNERKHQTNIDLAKGLYHPKYSPNKDEVNISEKNSSLDKSFGINATNNQSNRNDQKNAECFSESIIKSISETSSSPSSLCHSQQIEIIPTSKQKSLTNIFRTKMLALNIDDLKKIEYRYSKGSWKKMLTQNNSNQIKCMLCNIVIIQSLGDIKQHIAGKKHQTVLDSVALLYHPVLANTKLDDQNPKLIEKDVTKTITSSTHSQSPQTMKSSDSESQLKDSSLVERNNSPETQNKNQTEKTTTEKRLTNKSRIVCTIELEDSPEREIEIKVKDEGSACVINPAAIVSQKTTSKDTSKNDKINQEENDQISNNSSFKQHSPYIQESCTAKSTNQSPNMTRKSQETRNQQTNREFEFRNLNQNKFLPLQSNETNESSFSTKKITVTSTVDSNVEGLIGVEYVVKILHNINDNSLRYECCLCEVEVDGIGMQWHLKGLQHRIKYLERHFPTAIREISQYKNNSSVMSQIVEKLAVAIEQYHGRDLPYECLYDEFRSNRHSVMSKVFSFKHASELNGPSFTDAVDKNAIDGFISNKDTYKNSEPDGKRKTTFDNHFSKRQKMTNTTLDVEEHKRLVEKFLANTNRTSHYGSSTKTRRSRSRSPSLKRYSGYHRRSRSPISKDSHIRSKSRDQDLDRRSCDKDIWQTYRRQFDRALTKLKDLYRKYRGDPETHPRYDHEWKQFWGRRTSELLAEGRDPSSYNFQPEWVTFFVNRMDELYGEAVEELRVSLRRDLGLESNCRESMDTRSYVGNKNIQSIGFQHIPNQNFQNNENYLGTIRSPQEQRMYYMQPTHQMYQMPQIRQIPPLVQYPIQAIQYPVHYQTQQQKQNPTDLPRECQEPMQSGSRAIDVKTTEQSLVSSEDKVRKNVPESTKKQTSTYKEMDIDTEAITPVSVLRILTALEDQLGSLGPKVIDLLSKALTLEKVKPNKSIETFLNTENCVFLETVREKLKGQLLTGVAEKNKVKAIRKAINDVTELLKIADEKVENELLNPPDPPILSSTTTKSLNVKPPNSSNVDKRDLASKLAAALAAQGRTDFTTEQLEQLVTVYSMINKKTQKSNATNLEKDNNIRQEQQQQKSLSDTLAAFMKSTSTIVKQTMNSDISQENYSNTSKLTTLTTGSQSHQSILKPSYNFGMLSNFDTSLNLNKSVRPSGNNNSHSHSVQNIISGSSSHTFSNQTSVIQSDWTRNRPSTSNTYGQQASIPPLLSDLSYSQNRNSFGNQSAVLANYDGVNERLTSGNRTVTRPNNPSQHSQGSGFNSQNNSQRPLPMSWSRQFGRKY